MENTESEPEVKRRDLDLLWVLAKTSGEINGKLDDLLTLAQQQVDLLRRLAERRDRV